MTKKDYELIAEAMAFGAVNAEKKRFDSMRTFEEIVREVARFLAADNPRFDRGRFISFVGKRFSELR